MTTTPREPTLDEQIDKFQYEIDQMRPDDWRDEHERIMALAILASLQRLKSLEAAPAAAGEGEGKWTQPALDKVRKEAVILRARGRAAPASRVDDRRLGELISAIEFGANAICDRWNTTYNGNRENVDRAQKLLREHAQHLRDGETELQRLRTLSAEAAPKCETCDADREVSTLPADDAEFGLSEHRDPCPDCEKGGGE